MKKKFRLSLKRTIAFIAALTIIASATVYTAFAEQGDESAVLESTEAQESTETQASAKVTKERVDDYTSMFPGVTSPKLKLSDPEFTKKDWYEYIEYEFYTEVKDGDMTFRIYKPTDYGAASIMAITDYNPKEVLGGTSNLTMNLGELQGVLDMAAQGGNISKDYAGLDLATGIASKMNGINEVMDNSKYYSKSSFLGIPGDKKYTGVTNDGYFNASSLEIAITETESVSVCKTVAMDSSYSTSDITENGKTSAKRVEVYDANTNTHEEQNYQENSDTTGTVISVGSSSSTDTYNLTTDIKNDIKHATAENTRYAIEGGVDAGVSGGLPYVVGHGGHTMEWSTEEQVIVVPKSETQKGTVKNEEVSASIDSNVEKTNITGNSSSDSSSIEHGLTSGEEDGVTYSNAKEMSVNIGYGVDYQYGNDHSLSVGVTRVFEARDDKEVKNVGWKLCEYIVKVPYYIEAVKTDTDGTEKVLYGQYVNYNLLNGVSRVFANGYIEHWYTGELVTYADFFDGFITATELVDMAQEQQKAKVPEGSR